MGSSPADTIDVNIRIFSLSNFEDHAAIAIAGYLFPIKLVSQVPTRYLRGPTPNLLVVTILDNTDVSLVTVFYLTVEL